MQSTVRPIVSQSTSLQVMRPIPTESTSLQVMPEPSGSSGAATGLEEASDYDVYITHGPGCADGIMAAWCFYIKLSPAYRKRLESAGGIYTADPQPLGQGRIHPNSKEGALELQRQGFPVVFVMAQPEETIPLELVKDKRVLITDLTPGKYLQDIIEASKFTYLLDHHPSSLTMLNAVNFPQYPPEKFIHHIDTDKSASGASLAWSLAFPESTSLPMLVDIVRIGDNWTWSDYPDARKIHKALGRSKSFLSFPRITSVFESITGNNQDRELSNLIAVGEQLLRYEDRLIQEALNNTTYGQLLIPQDAYPGYRLYRIAYVYADTLYSEIGSKVRGRALENGYTTVFGATWKYTPYKNIVTVSLRDPAEGLDLAAIAQSLPGTISAGGHAHAASFSFHGLEHFGDYIVPTNTIIEKPKLEALPLDRLLRDYQTRILDRSAKQVSIGWLQVFTTVYTVAYIGSSFLRDEIGPRLRYYAESSTRGNTRVDLCATWQYIPARRKQDMTMSIKFDVCGGSPDLDLSKLVEDIETYYRQQTYPQLDAYGNKVYLNYEVYAIPENHEIVFAELTQLHVYLMTHKPTSKYG